MKTIMQDIAKMAGVSPGTVSNALNNRKGVGQETKNKIIKIAEDLGYFDNRKKNEDKLIRLIIFKKHGYVVSDTQFFTALMQACENECRERGYELLVSQIIHGENDKEQILKIIDNNKIDGILLLATEMDETDFKNFDNVNIPLIVLDSYFPTKKYDCVVINNLSGSYAVANYLIENGHTRLGILASKRNINNFEYRCIGFIKAIHDFNLNFDEDDKVMLESTLDGAYRDMKEYLLKNNRKLPSAFFALNDIIALGAIKAMQEENIKIPEDVSIIGFDDIPFSSLSNPGLTTVKVYTNIMGKMSVRRLIERINDPDDISIKMEIDTRLVERDSVKNLK